jgi:hypothetical protein
VIASDVALPLFAARATRAAYVRRSVSPSFSRAPRPTTSRREAERGQLEDLVLLPLEVLLLHELGEAAAERSIERGERTFLHARSGVHGDRDHVGGRLERIGGGELDLQGHARAPRRVGAGCKKDRISALLASPS